VKVYSLLLLVIGITKTSWWRLEFGDHLGGLVGDPTQKLYTVVRDPPRQRGKESSHREHLVLASAKGSDTLARVLQRGLGKCAKSSIPQEKIGGVSLPLLYIPHLL
jgi:hypothetical protein